MLFYPGGTGIHECVYGWRTGIRTVSGRDLREKDFAVLYFYSSLCAGSVLSGSVSHGSGRRASLCFSSAVCLPVPSAGLRSVAAWGAALPVGGVVNEKMGKKDELRFDKKMTHVVKCKSSYNQFQFRRGYL